MKEVLITLAIILSIALVICVAYNWSLDREFKRTLDHRKIKMRRPRDEGSTIQPLVEFICVIAMALFFFAVLAGFCH